MVSRRFHLVAFVACLFAGLLPAQTNMVASQSPRQALVEMFSGSEKQFTKHLTLEVQNQLAQLMKDDSSAAAKLVRSFSPRTNKYQKFDAFDLGPILFALNDSRQNSRLEVHIDSDQLNGDEDNITVSLHSFHSGIEQDLPLGARLFLNLRLQEGVWRLNAITLNATVPLGDPGILERSWRSLPVLNFNGAENASAPAAESADAATDDSPRMAPFRAVRMIGLAENLYARQHPDVGYTCDMPNLVNVGKGLNNGEFYKFMDPDFADGMYNGYRFALIGCQGKPARTFQVTAEPLDGRGRAYCSDDRHNLRVSADGKALTCLVEGKIAQR
jgi:hypothetical protein